MHVWERATQQARLAEREPMGGWAEEIARALTNPKRAAGLKPLPVAAATLSLVTIACAGIASITTLVWDGAFPASSPLVVNGVLAEARGWSVVTLALAIPLAL